MTLHSEFSRFKSLYELMTIDWFNCWRRLKTDPGVLLGYVMVSEYQDDYAPSDIWNEG